MNCLLATYIHDLSPFLLHIKGEFGVRWYGMMYVVGFICAYFLLRWFVRLKTCELKEDKVADFITAVAVLGVMIGGRLGYMLFYNWDTFWKNPLSFFQIMGGGMSSHGAIFGITIVVYFFARWQKISWLGLGDHIVITGPLGVFFGRIGNFINGELYGRKTDHARGMKFPSELYDTEAIASPRLITLAEEAKSIAPELSSAIAEGASRFQLADMMIATARKNDEFQTMMAELLTVRHPSQIYQALCEGLLVFLILLAVRLKWKNAYHGFISGLFFIIYAIARILVENVRQPDSSLIMGITKGQFYSVIMLIIGAAFIAWSFYTKRQNEIQPERGTDVKAKKKSADKKPA